jgi:hypothetical protein
MKKVVILLLAVLLFSGCEELPKEEKKNEPVKYSSIFDYEDYKEIKLDNIESITLIKYGMDGDKTKEITDKDEIEKLYNTLKELKVGEETPRSCEDNTTIYRFNMSNGKSVSIEIECDWFVINRKHYNIVN